MEGIPFPKSQHTYFEGKSTGTPVHTLISTIKQSLQYKQYTLAAYLNIEGIFSNVNTNVIKEVLTKIRLEAYLTH